MIWASLLQLQVVITFHVPIQVICLAVRISRIKLQLPVGFHWSPSSTSCHQEQLEVVLLNLSVWFPLQVCFLPEHAANPLQNLSLSEDLGWVWFIFSLLIFPHPLAGQWGLDFYGGHERHDTRSSLDLCSTSRWEWCHPPLAAPWWTLLLLVYSCLFVRLFRS